MAETQLLRVEMGCVGPETTFNHHLRFLKCALLMVPKLEWSEVSSEKAPKISG